MRRDESGVLLVGPKPPPHGGVSVHLSTARRRLAARGLRCRLIDPSAIARRGDRSRAAAALGFAGAVARGARRGWAVHLHSHGHSERGWLLILLGALAARRAPARLLTLHSGLTPGFLAAAPAATRWLARRALARYDRVVCVNAEIATAIAGLGVEPGRVAIVPAHLAAGGSGAPVPEHLELWLATRRPLLSTTLSFRAEYGFEVLLAAVARLRADHPDLGCVVLGGGPGEAAARREVERQGLAGAVLLAGDVAHALCRTLIARSDLFVRTARADGDSLSVREALALGVPVVATAVGARPAGCVLFEPGDEAGLAAAAGPILGRSTLAPARASTAAAGDGFEALLDVYRQLRLPVPALSSRCWAS
jgi:glycosyltransferase involved in cell wall biosynthesis